MEKKMKIRSSQSEKSFTLLETIIALGLMVTMVLEISSVQGSAMNFSEYERKVNSSYFSMKLPSVISLKKYIPLKKRIPFTRFNLFLRDHFKCQYCDLKFKASELTFDHVVSRANGGLTDWNNVVSACFKCNNKKGSLNFKDANMKLIKTPKKPTFNELREAGKLFPPNYLHHTWSDFLYWDTVLEKN